MADYNDSYTSRRRTRIYQREQGTQAIDANTIGQTQIIPPKRKLFDGLSVAQIVAGAAAAATSVALASYIGIAGSIIGAAISSVVTVVSSQIYRRFLDASAQKIKNAGVLAQTNLRDSRAAATVQAPLGVRGARVAPSRIRERAAAARAKTQRKVVLFSVLAAVLAVTACAAAIWLGTAGAGIGEKTQIIPALPAPQTGTTQTADDAAGDTPAEQDPVTPATDQAATDTEQAPATDADSAGGSNTEIQPDADSPATPDGNNPASGGASDSSGTGSTDADGSIATPEGDSSGGSLGDSASAAS